MENKPIAFIRELMKGKTEVEILEAEQNFRDYLEIVWKIASRIEREKNPSANKDEFDDDQVRFS